MLQNYGNQTIHGLFDEHDKLNQLFEPLVNHERVTITMTLFISSPSSSTISNDSILIFEINDNPSKEIEAPYDIQDCDNGWYKLDDEYCIQGQ